MPCLESLEGCIIFKSVNRGVTNGRTYGPTARLKVELIVLLLPFEASLMKGNYSRKNKAVAGKEKVGVSTKKIQGDMKVIKGKILYQMTQNGL